MVERNFCSWEQAGSAIEDSKKFVRTVPRFTVTYGSLCNPWMADLCAALAAQGISRATQQETKGKSKFWYPAGDIPANCWCGACLDCLVASGHAIAAGFVSSAEARQSFSGEFV